MRSLSRSRSLWEIIGTLCPSLSRSRNHHIRNILPGDEATGAIYTEPYSEPEPKRATAAGSVQKFLGCFWPTHICKCVRALGPVNNSGLSLSILLKSFSMLCGGPYGEMDGASVSRPAMSVSTVYYTGLKANDGEPAL